jgi:dienelactone hydrolase
MPCCSQLLCLALALSCAVAHAAPRALPSGQVPNDVRLNKPKDLNGYFPFAPAEDPGSWQARAAALRRQILVSQGLWPLPTKTPLNAVIHGKTAFEGYTVEKVYFEAMPGFYVTGSLYRPVGASGKRPGVLRPHGHWPNGRFHDKGEQEVRKEIEQEGERYENGGRSPLQAMNVQLARMGCVVFHYDMIGYADSTQITQALAHGFKQQRPEMNTAMNWGLFSPQAEAHLQSVMGLQTWSSIRALDFLTSLDDVDASRIGVTGASGGGTQTFILGAIDPRPTVTFPAVMVSTAMQGGCTCENASCLRVNAGNVDFAALFAPKPLGMTAANDWTKEMATKGFPELQQHYKLLGAADRVSLTSLLQFGHNYNAPSRSAMYHWFNKYLELRQPEPIVEQDYQRLTREQLTVWDAEHPQPPGGPDVERKLLRHWHDDAHQQLAALTPGDGATLDKFRETVGGGWQVLLNRPLPDPADLEYEATNKTDEGNHFLIVGVVRNKKQGEEVPMAFLHPKTWNGQVVVWIDDAGKASLFNDAGQPRPAVQQLVAAGTSVVGLDLFLQGEFLADGRPPEHNREVEGNREFAGFTYGYNSPVFAQRVHDVLTAVVFCSNHERRPEKLDLIGLSPQAGPIVAAARAQAGHLVRKAAVDTHGFRFSKLNDYRHIMFLPGAAKYGDVPALLALSAPHALWVGGEGKGSELAQAAFKAANMGGNLQFSDSEEAAEHRAEQALKWLQK